MSDNTQMLLDAISLPIMMIVDTQIFKTNQAFEALHPGNHGTLPCALDQLLTPTSQQAILAIINDGTGVTPRHLDITFSADPQTTFQANLQAVNAAEGDGHMLTFTGTLTKSINSPINAENFPIGVFRTSLDGKLLYGNNALCELLGYDTLEALLQGNVYDHYLDPSNRDRNVSELSPTMGPYAIELDLQSNSGKVFRARIRGQVERNAQGQATGFVGTLEDVTGEYQQRLALRESEARLQHRNQQLETLQRINRALLGNIDRSKLLNLLLDHLHDLIPFESASIWLMRGNSPYMVAAYGLPDDVNFDDITDRVRYDHYLMHKSPTKDEFTIIADVTQHPNWITIPETDTISCWLSVPLRYETTTLGFLNLDHSAANFFTQEHGELATMVAQQAAIAIHTSNLYEKAQIEITERQWAHQALIDYLARMQILYDVLQAFIESHRLQHIIPTVLESIADSLGGTASILLFEDDTQATTYRHAVGDFDEDEWTLYNLLTQRDPADHTYPAKELIYPDGLSLHTADGRSVIAAVVQSRGLLMVISDLEQENFTLGDREWLVTIANQFTIALENNRLYAQLEAHNRNLEQRVAESTHALELERQHLQAILDATGEGIFYMQDFKILYSNPSFCQMLGYSAEELIGQSLSFISDEIADSYHSTLLNRLHDLQASGRDAKWREERQLRQKNGAYIYAAITFTLSQDALHDNTHVVAVVHDITQERALYLQQAQFFANAAHELRTPLSSFALRLHILRQNPQDLERHLDKLDRVAQFITNLVEELLDLSRFERGSIQLEKSRHNVADLIEEARITHAPYAEEKGVNVTLQLPDEPLYALVDQTRIVQLVANLFVNAINYTDAGGEIEIKAREETIYSIPHAVIEVADTGIGIDPRLLPEKIFQPFSRPREGNRQETGMGLALCREIVQTHGGNISVTSAHGVGSVFRATIPINEF